MIKYVSVFVCVYSNLVCMIEYVSVFVCVYSLDVIRCDWLGLKHQLTDLCVFVCVRVCVHVCVCVCVHVCVFDNRSLQLTETCYSQLVEACNDSSTLVSRLSDASLTTLADTWECEEEEDEIPECIVGCDLKQAQHCIDTMSSDLQHWGPYRGDSCR